jgi:hypothetical protein
MKKSTYQFNMRPDLPPGFQENLNYPALPLITEYLRPYDGKTFADVNVFKEVLKGFDKYADKKENQKMMVHASKKEGNASIIKNGLIIDDDRHEGWIYALDKTDNNHRCYFGRLELMTITPDKADKKRK